MSEKMMQNEAKKYGFTIREMQKNQSDAQLLANCLTTFDDPESWPSGFGGGEPFTAERILESLERETPLAKYIAEMDGKIVGHCDVLEHFHEEDIVYVGLLGVDPEYQGKKIGKHLLIYATNKALELEKDVITLHTWGGNLKAVPLYKKAGYFWAPESSVYMENFFPGILRRKLFRRYFDKFDWYNTYRRDLELAPDIEKIKNMDVYTNYFEADENNSLQVIIDVRSKKICGFELKTPEGTIGVSCLIDSSIGYAGFGKIPVMWTLKNETPRDIQFTMKIKVSDGLLIEEEPQSLLNIVSGETKIVESVLVLADDVATVTNPKDVYNRTKQLLQTIVNFDEEEIDLTVGVVPIDPLAIEIYPNLRSVIPNEEATIPIRLWNRTQEKMKGSVVISEQENVELDTKVFAINLESNEYQSIPLVLKVTDKFTKKVVPLTLNIYKEERNKKQSLPKEILHIPVIQSLIGKRQNCSGYIVRNKHAILENNTIRVKINIDHGCEIQSVTDKRDNKTYSFYSGAPDLGMPFVGWGNELQRLKPVVKIITTQDQVSLVLTVDSSRKPGIKLERIITVISHLDMIKFTSRVINESNKIQKNIGLRIISDSWDSYTFEGKAYFPLQRGLLKIVDFLNFNKSRYIAKDAKEWKECWHCTEFAGSKLFGAMWDDKYLTKIEASIGNLPTFEYHFGDLEAGQGKETSFYYVFTRGSWKDYRKLYKEIIEGNSIPDLNSDENKLDEIATLAVETESEIYGKQDSFNIQPLNYKDSMKFKVVNNTMSNLKGTISLELPKGVSFEDDTNTYQEEFNDFVYEKPIEITFKIQASEIYHGRIFPIKVIIKVRGASFDLTFLAQIANKDAPISIQSEPREDGKELISLDNGRISLQASEDHAGGITSFSLLSISKKNTLQSSWPDVKPFLYASHWYGGISASIQAVDNWSQITHKERFSSSILDKGLVKGIKFTSFLQSEIRYNGLQIEIEYTTIAKSNVLRALFRVTNTTDAHMTFIGGFGANIAVSEEIDNTIHFSVNGKAIKRHHSKSFWVYKHDHKWVVFEDAESKMAMAVLGPSNNEFHLEIEDKGDLSNAINTIQRITIPPKGSKEYELLFILYPLNHELLTYLEDLY